MAEHDLMTCMLCGCCSYVCPSNIPLSQMFALGKTMLRKTREKQLEMTEADDGQAA